MDIRTDGPMIREIDKRSLDDIFQIYRQCGDFLALGPEPATSMETAITENKDIITIRAGVQVNNPAAIAFWDKMGYTIDSEPELLADKTVAVKLKKAIRH
ncbi:MAG: hypothetical protein GX111_01730 [Clostridiales bacterium]|jgi:hypothetical protein|nr:hypothetical protein [Clostridiales bacterium]